MAFSLSGSTITQTGTDTDLSGLVGLTNVTTTTANGRSIYQLANTRLVVNGTLSIDPELEELFFTGYGNVITFQVNTGTLNIGQEVDIGATLSRFSSGTVARFSRNTDSPWRETESDFRIETGGTVNWYGGSFFSRRVFAIYGTFNTFSQNCQWINQASGVTQVRQRSSNCSIDGFITRGSFLTLIANATKIDNWTPYETADGNQALGLSTSTPANTWLTLKRFNPQGLTSQALAFWSDKWGRLINCFTGSNVVAAGNLDNDSRNEGLYEVRQELTMNYSDLDGVDQDGVKAFMVDTDNSNRLAASQIGSNPSYTADRSYSGTSSSGSVTFDTDGGVLVAAIWRTVGGARASNNEYDYRSVSGTNADDFTFFSINYDLAINQANLILKGSETDTRPIVMLPDLLITETIKATVDAYTAIDNAQQFYDRAKSYLYDNYAGEAATIVTRSGNTIDSGSYNVTIDPTASSAFAFDGTTVTIKTTSFIGTTQTTGTVTDLGAPRTIQYGVTGGQLIINDASAPWTVSGNVVIDDIINNDAANNLIINVTGGANVSTSEAGTGNGEVNLVNSVTIKVTCVDINGVAIENARVYLKTATDGVIYNDLTNSSGVISFLYNYTSDEDLIESKSRKGSGSPYLKTSTINGTITSNGLDARITMLSDE